MGYLTCEYFFVRQFNSQKDVGQIGCRVSGKSGNWHGS